MQKCLFGASAGALTRYSACLEYDIFIWSASTAGCMPETNALTSSLFGLQAKQRRHPAPTKENYRRIASFQLLSASSSAHRTAASALPRLTFFCSIDFRTATGSRHKLWRGRAAFKPCGHGRRTPTAAIANSSNFGMGRDCAFFFIRQARGAI